MVLRNHIAYRFLTDSDFWMELIETTHPDLYKEFELTNGVSEGVRGLYQCLSNKNNKPYLITNSVIEHLDMLKIAKKNNHFNWDVFRSLPEQKVTFVFEGNRLLRMYITKNVIWFCYLTFTLEKGSKENGKSYWITFYIDRETGVLCEHFDHPDVLEIEEFIYKFLCFFYLTENTEEIIPAGKVHGTRKTGKVSNDFGFSITMVTAKWNITTIRTEAFGVRGHFRVQPCGKGRSNYEIIFIEPFVKQGYKRTAAKITSK